MLYRKIGNFIGIAAAFGFWAWSQKFEGPTQWLLIALGAALAIAFIVLGAREDWKRDDER